MSKPIAKIDQILFAFFPKEHFLFGDKAAFLNELKKKEEFLDGNEIILPIPADAPPDIPTMFLSKEKTYEVRFARGRIEYVSLSEAQNDEKNLTSSIKNILSKISQENIKNIGIVIYSSFDGINEIEVKSKIANLFNNNGKNFCKAEESTELILRSLYNNDLEINKEIIITNTAVTLNSAKKLENQIKLGIDLDVNTFPSESIKMNIDAKFIKEFIESVFLSYNNIISQLVNEVLL